MTQAPLGTITSQRQRLTVATVTGSEVDLLHPREKRFYEEARDKYLSDFKFTVASDYRALDRLLLLEVQMHRYQWQLLAGMDYDSVDLEPVEETALRRATKELVTQIAECQRDLGLTKTQRDKASEDSVGAYITKLKLSAKAHGIKRETEVAKAIELSKELFALCGAFQRSNPHERMKLGFESADDIISWVLEYMKLEFDSIDEKYRAGSQRFFVRNL